MSLTRGVARKGEPAGNEEQRGTLGTSGIVNAPATAGRSLENCLDHLGKGSLPLSHILITILYSFHPGLDCLLPN